MVGAEGEAIPTECEIGTSQTEQSHAGSSCQTGIEVGFYLSLELCVAYPIVADVESEARGEREETQRRLSVKVMTFDAVSLSEIRCCRPKVVFGQVEIQVARTCDTLARVETQIVTHKAIGFVVRMPMRTYCLTPLLTSVRLTDG